MYRVLEIDTRDNSKDIICPLGSFKQVRTRIRTMKRFNKVMGIKNRKYKPIKIENESN